MWTILYSCPGNFYPRSPCGERPLIDRFASDMSEISIHALLAESDLDRWLAGLKGTLFLSTLSLRRATHPKTSGRPRNTDFYPRSPCGERLVVLHIVSGARKFLSTLSLRRATLTLICDVIAVITISIHALLAESDRQNPGKHYVAFRFLSTLSLRRATGHTLNFHTKARISIHALLAESDARKNSKCRCQPISIHALLAESDQCRL